MRTRTLIKGIVILFLGLILFGLFSGFYNNANDNYLIAKAFNKDASSYRSAREFCAAIMLIGLILFFIGIIVTIVGLIIKENGLSNYQLQQLQNQYFQQNRTSQNPTYFDEKNQQTFQDGIYCSECGKKLPKDSKFCNECGNKIE